MLEAVLSRGDRRVGEAIYVAWKMGAKFDAWQDQYKYDVWMKAFEMNDLDPAFYAYRERELDELLPWDHISPGVSRRYLANEYKKIKIDLPPLQTAATAAMLAVFCRLSPNCGMKIQANCGFVLRFDHARIRIHFQREKRFNSPVTWICIRYGSVHSGAHICPCPIPRISSPTQNSAGMRSAAWFYQRC